MSKRIYYQPSHVIHEGRRTARIVELMQSGFRRWEARELSRIPKDDGALQAMTEQRERMANRIFRRADKDGLSIRQAQRRMTVAIADYYLNKIRVKTVKMEKVVKGGRAIWGVVSRDRAGFPHQWRKKVIALSRMRQGKRREDEFGKVSIRPGDFRDTPGHKGQGNRKTNKSRRRAAVRDAKSAGKLRIDVLENEYRDSFKLVSASGTQSVKRAQMDRQRDLKHRLDEARTTGAKYG